AFRITAPGFITVVRKRLDLALQHLSERAERTQHFTLRNGAIVTYPSTKLGKYLMTLYSSIFNPNRSIRLILEALSGKNIRDALEMFTDILMSGYLSEAELLAIAEGHNTSIPEWLVIRVLMRSNYR